MRDELVGPLLELAQAITGLETTFVTLIDWEAQQEKVVYARNTSDLVVPEGASGDWSDSLCRSMLLSGHGQTMDARGEFPASLGAASLGIQTFYAVAVLAGDEAIGTVCGASRRVVEVDESMLDMMRLVARAMAAQLRVHKLSEAHQARAHRAEQLALTDELTGLPNRRAFDARAEEELVRSARHGYSVAALAVDVDAFKSVNDVFGHDAGDNVLRAVGHAMCSVARTEDLVARLGGDEFALLLAHTDSDGAVLVAERLRAEFAHLAEQLGTACSLSVGVSTAPFTARAQLMGAADRALYRCKQRGRNRVEVWSGADAAST